MAKLPATWICISSCWRHRRGSRFCNARRSTPPTTAPPDHQRRAHRRARLHHPERHPATTSAPTSNTRKSSSRSRSPPSSTPKTKSRSRSTNSTKPRAAPPHRRQPHPRHRHPGARPPITIPNRSTVLLGGLITERTERTINGVPVLIQIPHHQAHILAPPRTSRSSARSCSFSSNRGFSTTPNRLWPKMSRKSAASITARTWLNSRFLNSMTSKKNSNKGRTKPKATSGNPGGRAGGVAQQVPPLRAITSAILATRNSKARARIITCLPGCQSPRSRQMGRGRRRGACFLRWWAGAGGFR